MPKGISETAFASQVEDLLQRFGWRWMHMKPAMFRDGVWSSRMNEEGKGFPDYCAVRPPRLIFAELKGEKGKVTPEQEAWLEDLRRCQNNVISEPLTLIRGAAIIRMKGKGITYTVKPEVYLWRPSDFEKIAEILR